MPPSFPSLDQFSVIQGKFYMQRFSNTSMVEHFWVPVLGASCSKLFVGTLRTSQSSISLVAWFARIDSHDSRKSGDSRESEIRVIHANRPDAL